MFGTTALWSDWSIFAIVGFMSSWTWLFLLHLLRPGDLFIDVGGQHRQLYDLTCP